MRKQRQDSVKVPQKHPGELLEWFQTLPTKLVDPGLRYFSIPSVANIAETLLVPLMTEQVAGFRCRAEPMAADLRAMGERCGR